MGCFIWIFAVSKCLLLSPVAVKKLSILRSNYKKETAKFMQKKKKKKKEIWDIVFKILGPLPYHCS